MYKYLKAISIIVVLLTVATLVIASEITMMKFGRKECVQKENWKDHLSIDSEWIGDILTIKVKVNLVCMIETKNPAIEVSGNLLRLKFETYSSSNVLPM